MSNKRESSWELFKQFLYESSLELFLCICPCLGKQESEPVMLLLEDYDKENYDNEKDVTDDVSDFDNANPYIGSKLTNFGEIEEENGEEIFQTEISSLIQVQQF